MAHAWRHVALGGFAAGLACAPTIEGGDSTSLLVAAGAIIALGLVAVRARTGAGLWLPCLGLATATAGLALGTLRIDAIDAGALQGPTGEPTTVRGYVGAVPRRADGEVAVRVTTPDGRLLIEAPEPVPDLDVGEGIVARGMLHRVPEWQRAYLARLGIHRVLETRGIEAAGWRRGGVVGALDAIRSRAQRALSAGTPESSANLLRGFVLGQDDRIDERTREEFERSGLAHLLAVSGQNVVLLAILAAAVLALLGVSIRARLVAILALIGVYALVTGAGPSIQRAGVMGAAGIAAALASRPRSRWYVLLLAAAVTLAIDPRAAADVGWQLSFAAVVGILACTAPLARLLGGPRPSRARRALAEAAALTVAATVATAPLISFHFGAFSVVSLPANLVAVVAEAPVMWLGMLAAAAGQLEWMPVEPVVWLAGLLAAYIAQVAEWFAAPSWAELELGLSGVAALTAAYGMLGVGIVLLLGWTRRRARLRLAGRPAALPALAALLAAVLLLSPASAGSGDRTTAPAGFAATVLDVGQGDAILLEPVGGAPILIDAGPADAQVATTLAERGLDRLAALVLTHADADHAGGAAEVLASTTVEHLAYARAPPSVLGAARVAGTATDRVGEGSSLRSAGLRLRVLWPPPRVGARPAPAAETNGRSLVVLARWRGFRMLLTGDAEAELAPVHSGDVDVLKVAHHGSEDAGLAALLAEAEPELALISVGADNPYGHPAPPTLATLERAGVPVLRTDLDGELELAVGPRAWTVGGGVSGLR